MPSLEERHGGPSKSVRSLANALAGQGDQVDLLTTSDEPQKKAIVTDAAKITVFPRAAPRWLTCSPQLRQHLLTTPADCIHNHALWLLPLNYAAKAAKKNAVPLVISPRGMMSGWAYQHRRWRKRISELFVHPGAFSAASGWHATSTQEADDIRALGFKQPICVSPNGVPIPTDEELASARTTWHQLCPTTTSRPVALFYSRFHRKKRLKELIALWLKEPRGDWLLLIAGVQEDYTATELSAEITAAGAQDKIAVFDGNGLPAPYAIASLFVLPSHSENFGLVIAEALAAGVPIAVTNTTPWEGVANESCGWCVAWENFPAALDTALATPLDALKLMGQRGRAWAAREFSWTMAAQKLQGFYRQLK